MPIDMDEFIRAIEKRPCIWNLTNEDYNNKYVKLKAWDEVLETVCDDWVTRGEMDRVTKVQDLQKKWKGLRDYWNRELKRNPPLESGGTLPKRRKTPILDRLQFLNTAHFKQQKPASSEATDEETHIFLNDDDSDSQSSSPPVYTNKKAKKMTVFQEKLLKLLQRNNEDDPNMCFLLSILPEMKSMTSKENFDFRCEVMKAIKKIKDRSDDPLPFN